MTDLIKITASGIITASAPEIRSAVINLYREAYGTDIDLSTGTADGIYINNISLMINNILSIIDFLNHNLDVTQASGTYLDNLCALSNITRKQATKSNASLQVTNIGSVASYTNLQFVDKSGKTWTNSGDVTFSANETKTLYVECDTIGAIEAPSGWIYQTVLLSNPLTVSQTSPANVGREIENDSELRARRSRTIGASGSTVLESLGGALLNISGIDDVKIYNNDTGSAISAVDGTTVDAHSVYVIIKKQAGVTISDSTIGTIIHQKLTPGIHSCDTTTSSYGTAKSYQFIPYIYGVTVADSEQNVYWKEAIGMTPALTFKITPAAFFNTNTEPSKIANTVIRYMNELHIGEQTTLTDLFYKILRADPLYKEKPTYTADISDLSFTNTQHDTFYNYSTFTTSMDGAKMVFSIT